MTFSNAGISMEDVPKGDDIRVQSIERRYMRVKTIQWMLLWAIVLVVGGLLVYFIKSLREPFWLLTVFIAVAFLCAFHFYVLKKSVAFKAYAIREHDVVYRTGWIVRSVKVVPFNRIQHCSVDEGALARRYGLASIRMFTSGGNDADISIPGLKAAFAADLRDLIISKIRQHGGGI